MGKRSNFERKPRDFYPTPLEAVLPLIPHLDRSQKILEPCAGDGALIDHLETQGFRVGWAFDIEPKRQGIERRDATFPYPAGDIDVIVTNPPWDRKVLHQIIAMRPVPAWLLFDADWVHTKQAIPYLPCLRKIVSVGRVKWIPDSKMTGKDNCAWHYFDVTDGPTEFVGRGHV